MREIVHRAEHGILAVSNDTTCSKNDELVNIFKFLGVTTSETPTSKAGFVNCKCSPPILGAGAALLPVVRRLAYLPPTGALTLC